MGNAHLLLLHELGVGAVVDNILTKDRSGKNSVNFLGADVFELAVENEVVSGRAYSDSGLAAEEDKGEDITVLVNVSNQFKPHTSTSSLVLSR